MCTWFYQRIKNVRSSRGFCVKNVYPFFSGLLMGGDGVVGEEKGSTDLRECISRFFLQKQK